MPQPAGFGGFFSVPASVNGQPLRELQTLANGLDAEL
jgi:hypothetical protein